MSITGDLRKTVWVLVTAPDVVGMSWDATPPTLSPEPVRRFAAMLDRVEKGVGSDMDQVLELPDE